MNEWIYRITVMPEFHLFIKNAFLKIRNIHRKAPVLESLFYKVGGYQAFIKKRLQHWCFPVNFAKFFKTPIFKNICERLLLIYLCLPIIKLDSPFNPFMTDDYHIENSPLISRDWFRYDKDLHRERVKII